MSSSMLQLSAYGPQDLYLTGNPQITFFKVVYRRHTNFSMETIKLFHSGGSNDFDSTTQYQINSGGADLIYKMYFTTTLPAIKLKTQTDDANYFAFRWLNWPGHNLIEECEITIGGQQIDKITGEWLHIWNELSQKSGKKEGYAEMVGNVPGLTQIQTFNKDSGDTNYTLIPEYRLNVPLNFWFTKNPGLSLPIIALNNTDILINLKTNKIKNMIWASHSTSEQLQINVGKDFTDNNLDNFKLTNTEIYAEHIFLDGPERKRFAQTPHEYLIEVLKTPANNTKINSPTVNKFQLEVTTLNSPTKEIIWTLRPSWFTDDKNTQPRGGKQFYNYTTEWNYSGFSGSGSSYLGPGLVGGRNPDYFYSKSIQNLSYDKSNFEPDFETGYFTQYDSKALTISGTSAINTGYDYIQKYHINNKNSSVNNYKTKFTDNVGAVGSGVLHADSNHRQSWDLNNIPVDQKIHAHNIWSSPGNRLGIYNRGLNPVKKASIILAGITKVHERDVSYFNLVQPYQHHTNIPAPGINVYSFALDPEEHQPSGSCNFANLRGFNLEIELTETKSGTSKYVPLIPAQPTEATPNLTTDDSYNMNVYAVCYNVFRIMSGMGALAYSS